MTGDHQTLALVLFSVFVAVTLGITTWVSRHRQGSAEEFYAGGRLFSPHGEWFRHRGRLHVRRVLPRDLRADRALRVRRTAVLGRLPGRLARRAVPGRRTGPQLRAVHARGRASRPGCSERPVRIAAGTSSVTVSVLYLVAQMVGAGSLVALLLGGTSAAAQSWTVDRGRRAHGDLRVVRRDAGHHLDPDRQGGAADGRRHRADRARPGAVPRRLRPVCCARRRRAQRSRQRVPRARPEVRRGLDRAARLHQPGARAGAGHGRAAAHPVPLLHRAHRAGRPAVRRLVDRAHRRLLPDDDRARFRRGGVVGSDAVRGSNAAGQHGRSAARP